MLLAQIKSNYSSGADSSSDDGENEDGKSSNKVKKEDDDDDNDEAEQQGIQIIWHFNGQPCAVFLSFSLNWFASILEADHSESSGSDVEVKKHGRRHKLLRHKLSLSEGESGEEKSAAKEKKKGAKKSKEKGGFVWFKCCISFRWS